MRSFAFLLGFISILKLHIRLTFLLDSTVIEVKQGMWTITGTENSEESGVQGGTLPTWKTDFNYKKKSLNFLIPAEGRYFKLFPLLSAWFMFVIADNSLKSL